MQSWKGKVRQRHVQVGSATASVASGDKRMGTELQELYYHRPTTVAEATRLLAAGDARVLAGGTDLIPQTREGRRRLSHVIDLKGIDELVRVERGRFAWKVGAASAIGHLGRNVDFVREHKGLLESARLIGSLQVQNRASIGGNLCNAAPSADAVPLLLSLGCEVEIAGPTGRRTVAAAIATGPGRTMLAPDELVVALIIPILPAMTAAKYLRFTPRREMDIAVAGVGTYLQLDDKGLIAAARLTLASVGPTPVGAVAAEKVLVGHRPSLSLFAAAADAAASDARPISDTRGSADYRRELVAVLSRRTLADCTSQLGVALS